MSDSTNIFANPLAGVTFGLRFESQGDRYVHSLVAEGDRFESEQLLLSSVEGDGQSDWPPSPPFQDVHQQVINECPVVMSVGMAGTSHWSVACGLSQTEEQILLEFDVACRINHAPDWLGSSYDLMGKPAGVAGPQEFQLELLEGFEFTIRVQGVDGSDCELAVQEDRLQILAMSKDQEPGTSDVQSTSSPSQTVRWQYQLEIRESNAR